MTYPRKPVTTNLPVIEPIIERWSPMAFDPKPVEEEKILAMFEAARWAPSSFNEQPWRYIYAQKGDTNRDVLESLLTEGNAWAKNAGVLMISFASKNFARNNKPNYHSLHDTGAASAYLVAQLPSLGLVGHQMQGFDSEHANEKLGVPDDFAPGSMIAVGYYGDHNALKDDWKQREDAPRVRKDLHEIAFNGEWKAAR